MKIKFEEIKKRKQWIHRELLRSLDNDTINNARSKGEFDVKIVVNGTELDTLNEVIAESTNSILEEFDNTSK